MKKICVLFAAMLLIVLIGCGGGSDDAAPTVQYISGVTAVSTGGSHAVALKGDGTVWAWGDNTYGELGYPTSTYTRRNTALARDGLTGITAVSAGAGYTLALKNDGTVWALGSNTYGSIGNGTTTVVNSTPVQVIGLTAITAISAGRIHALALKNDGTVWAWGGNYQGQLGDGSYTNRYTPVQVHQ